MPKFSDRYLDALKPRASRYEVQESDGFRLRILPTGTKVFCYVYRLRGKLKRVTIGQYPAMKLKDARVEYNRLWEELKNGGDPAATHKTRTAHTFKDLASEYLTEHAKRTKKEKSWQEDERILDKDLLPAFGDRPAGAIGRREVLLFLEKLRDGRSLGRQVNIIRNLIRQIYNFGLQREYPGVENNPVTAIGKIGEEKEKDRVLSAKEIRTFWTVLPTLNLDESTVRCLRFILATGQRPGECLFIDRTEIDGKWWTIPKEKMKTAKTRKDNIREHRVHLSPLALSLLGEDEIPFPVPSHVSALALALRRAYGPTKKKVVRLAVAPFTPHDLRRTAATLMAEGGVSQETINKVLGHTMEKVQRTYNRYSYDKEKIEAMTVLEASLRRVLFANEVVDGESEDVPLPLG